MSKRTPGRSSVERAVSAGGVVYRRASGGVEVVMCGRQSEGIWGLPKGTPDAGESLEQTALREVSEETGLQVEIDRKVGAVEYWFASPQGGHRVHKWVHHYLMRPTGGSVDDHDHEYDTVVWMPVEAALRTLSYPNEANIVRQAVAMIEKDAP